MKFSQLWILCELSLIVWFLMAEINFNCGISPCASHYVQRKRNSSDQNLLPDYLSLIINQSRELEETIYSDVLNNLRTLVRTQNTETEFVNECNKSGENIKKEKAECNNRNRTGSYDSFLSGEEEKEKEELAFRTFIPGVSEVVRKNSYLLGYSGNPFGTRKLIAGATEMTEDEQKEKGIIDPRKKRSVLHLYNMVLCSTGCNPVAYKGYGCYCGFLGSGFVVDGIDSCCKMHDWCYNSAGCPMFLEYFIPYLWKCYHRQPLCAIDHGYYGNSGSCSQRLCECDRQLALCLRRYPCPTTKALCTSSPWRLLQNILML